MGRLNLAALTLFAVICVLAHGVSRGPEDRARRVVRVLCCLLLGGNLVRYALVFPLVYHVVKLPAEFSTVAYFVVPVILLAGWRRLECWAAYSGMVTGFFYYLAMILAGQALYGADRPVNVLISLLCHGTLLFCGFVTGAFRRYTVRELAWLPAGMWLIALRALVLRPLVLGRDSMLIYILLDARLVRQLLPEDQLTTALPMYYLLLPVLLLGTVWLFCRWNRHPRKRTFVLQTA